MHLGFGLFIKKDIDKKHFEQACEQFSGTWQNAKSICRIFSFIELIHCSCKYDCTETRINNIYIFCKKSGILSLYFQSFFKKYHKGKCVHPCEWKGKRKAVFAHRYRTVLKQKKTGSCKLYSLQWNCSINIIVGYLLDVAVWTQDFESNKLKNYLFSKVFGHLLYVRFSE